MTYRPFLLIAITASVFGAGCPKTLSRTPSQPAPVVQPPSPTRVASAQGFGKLPQLTSGANPNTLSAIAPTTPMSQDATEKSVGAASAIVRPIPIPPPNPNPATVTYDVSAELPSWGTDDNVLRVRKSEYSSSAIGTLAQATGLPAQALGPSPLLEGFNFAWRDRETFEWSYDAVQRMVSFWKQAPNMYQNAPQKNLPAVDDAAMIKLADDFLAVHGFSGLTHGAATVEKPWGNAPMPTREGGTNIPCPVTMMDIKVSAVAPDAGSGSGVATPAFYPCWVAAQVTVVYDALQSNRLVRDAGGNPFRNITVTIDLNDNAVTGGSIWLNQEVDSSSYPLIDKATALKKLQAGGRNPIWPWMQDGNDIHVRIKTIDFVWMRYDVWSNNQNVTYYIPAIAGSGEVEYAKDNIQPYTTIVPLVIDDAFEPIKDQPQPIPLNAEAGAAAAVPPSVAPTPKP